MSTISVIIPAYNAEKYLADSINSVLGQTLPPDEILVIDDGSTDSTPQVASQFGARIRYFRKENGGPSSARNLGLTNASGDLIAFQDSDDIWVPDKLRKQSDYLAAHPEYALVYSDLTEVDEHLNILQRSKFNAIGFNAVEGEVFAVQLLSGFIWPQTTLFRREALESTGLFDEQLRSQEDTEFFLRFTYHHKIGSLRECTVLRRRHSQNLSNNFNETSLRSSLLVLEAARGQFEIGPLLSFKLHRELARRYARVARHDLGCIRTEQARSEAVSSIRHWVFGSGWIWLALASCPKSLIRWLKEQKEINARRIAGFI